jgi:hypothetical protein
MMKSIKDSWPIITVPFSTMESAQQYLVTRSPKLVAGSRKLIDKNGRSGCITRYERRFWTEAL